MPRENKYQGRRSKRRKKRWRKIYDKTLQRPTFLPRDPLIGKEDEVGRERGAAYRGESGKVLGQVFEPRIVNMGVCKVTEGQVMETGEEGMEGEGGRWTSQEWEKVKRREGTAKMGNNNNNRPGREEKKGVLIGEKGW